MTIGTEVISDEFPGAVGVVMVRRETPDGVVCQVLWTSDSGGEFMWWSNQDTLEALG